jgi:hypothetical protein
MEAGERLMRVIRGSWRWLLPCCALLLALASAQPARALTLSLLKVAPTPSIVGVTDSIFVEVFASGLTAGDAPSITAFDLDLGFDATRVSFVGLSWSVLGLTTCTLDTYTPACDALVDVTSTSSVVTFAAASLLDPAVINANQPASGALATLEFLANAEGTAVFSLLGVDVAGTISGTTEGPLSASTQDLSVGIVPEPGTAMLVLLGLAGLGFLRRPARS